MLRSTFLHVPGVGPFTERRLWEQGIETWDDYGSRELRYVSRRQRRALDAELRRSRKRLRERDAAYFAKRLPASEHWRAFGEFRARTAYLDIETTGLSPRKDAITVIGLWDGRRVHTFVRGTNLSAFPAAVRGYDLLVTYNGARFDLPAIRNVWPSLRLGPLHVDLMNALHRLGIYGGLKSAEQTLGIRRSRETQDLRGMDAVELWGRYRGGDDGALTLLVKYNREDTANLEPLMDFAYGTLRTACLRTGFVDPERVRSEARRRS